jgi:thiol-disulfide isomerase/thioredoxin
MMLRTLSRLMLAASGLALSAQGVFTNANSPDAPICPRVMREKSGVEMKHNMGADTSATRYSQWGDQFFPQAERKDVSLFAAYDEKAKGTSIASLKGKVVLVGLWSTHCDPSAKMLMEFASLYAKRDQYGFEILSVNFDETQQDSGIEGGWRAISKSASRTGSSSTPARCPSIRRASARRAPRTSWTWSTPCRCCSSWTGRGNLRRSTSATKMGSWARP